MFDNFFKSKEENKEVPLAIRAIAALQQNRYPEALRLLNEYIYMIEGLSKPMTQDDAVFYYNRSIAKVGLNDIEGAIDDLQKCLKIAKLHQAYYELFRLQKSHGNNQLALEALVNAYETGSQDAEKILRENTNYFAR